MPQSPLYTIGYAPHEPGSFIAVLARRGVTAVAGVRHFHIAQEGQILSGESEVSPPQYISRAL
jgi:hypothetical protein